MRSGGHPFSLEAVQNGKHFFILKLKGNEDRDAAEKLVGSSVWISSEDRKKLPEGEYYWGEIIGLQIVTEDDQVLGRIEAVFPAESNDVYAYRGGEKGDPAAPHRRCDQENRYGA
jgi:16S rRNA processing protein RimM